MRRFSSCFTALAVIIATLFICSVAIADSPIFEKVKTEKALVVGLNSSYPPFALWTDNGPLGFDVELAKALALALGLDPKTDLKFVAVKPDEAAGAVVSGEIDIAIAALTPTPLRLSKVAFSVPYIYVTKAALYQRAKIPRVIIGEILQPMPVKSYNDLFKLKPERIGVKEGTVTFVRTKKEFPSATVIGYADTKELGRAILYGKVDAVVHEDPFVRYFAAANKAESRGFITLAEPVNKEGLCVAYRYGDPDFARFLDGFIRYLEESGAIGKWKKLYFDNAKWTGGAK